MNLEASHYYSVCLSLLHQDVTSQAFNFSPVPHKMINFSLSLLKTHGVLITANQKNTQRNNAT